MSDKLKLCNSCLCYKQENLFYKSKRYADGFDNRCKFCKENKIKSEKYKNRLGEQGKNNQGSKYTIIEYESSTNCSVLFETGYCKSNCFYNEIKNGTIKDLLYPSVYGIGYVGVGKYNSKDDKKVYNLWQNLIERAYSEKFKSEHLTYKDCTIDIVWLNFQVFADWFYKNWKPWMNSTWHLDKDILVKGNKIYSPETCAFVPVKINSLLTKCDKVRGNYPIGVQKKSEKFVASISMEGRCIRIACFDTPEEAFQVYKTAKEAYIKEVADKWKGLISDKVYEALISYKVEITD